MSVTKAIISSDNGFLMAQWMAIICSSVKAIIWTNAGILLIETLGRNFREHLNIQQCVKKLNNFLARNQQGITRPQWVKKLFKKPLKSV